MLDRAAALLGCTMGLALPGAFAAAQDAAEPAVEERVSELLARMATTLASAERLRLVVDVEFDVVQETGESVEFGGQRRVTLRRPDRLRVDVRGRSGEVGGMIFDGERIVAFDEAERVYAATPVAGELEAALDFTEERLETPVPLADLLRRDLAESVLDRIETGRYVGEESIDGHPCHHLALRGETVDFQVWIQREGPALPRRVVVRYREAEGHPQFRASFREWELSPELLESTFAFARDGYERIPFALRRRPARQEAAEGASR